MDRDPLGLEDQGKHSWHFPHPLGPQEACWAPRLGPPPSKAHSSCVGPEGMVVGRGEADGEGPYKTRGSGGG